MSAQSTYQLTRIAPTPSGYLHIGNVLSFAITAALAERSGAKILLRIDDLDQQRVMPQYVQDIFDTLNFLEIQWHMGPRNYQEYKSDWSQLHRLDSYQKALQQLKDEGHVFACTCSRSLIKKLTADETYPGICLDKNIPFDTGGACWRIKTDERQLSVNTFNGVVQAHLTADANYFIVRKKDGFAAYQLASVIDDINFGVDLIVRGQDLWSSTLAQLFLAEKLKKQGLLNNVFHHHALLTNLNGDKLSKSAGDTSIQSLRKQGKTAADIYTAIATAMGFNDPVNSWQQLAQLINV
ncbi:glutamate--tRNA ligase family protein [Mucilaginibacter sp. KACC 22063]|uniref:glutamate--tRNA ligase family protein n=1 Tax=Mucilaginibacter sp. KACC 22063 TaxID=3025666 RepID=UPI002366B3F1|nr:glutamate--tRNA ligase family protein [Mucilaginibacter sp. KACC 22063]WDF55228.1 glutamate--tRNA ligase family protein [Mucilaginibacter sp. KACC 22063]